MAPTLVQISGGAPRRELALDAGELRMHDHTGKLGAHAPQVPKKQEFVGIIKPLSDAAGDQRELQPQDR